MPRVVVVVLLLQQLLGETRIDTRSTYTVPRIDRCHTIGGRSDGSAREVVMRSREAGRALARRPTAHDDAAALAHAARALADAHVVVLTEARHLDSYRRLGRNAEREVGRQRLLGRESQAARMHQAHERRRALDLERLLDLPPKRRHVAKAAALDLLLELSPFDPHHKRGRSR